MVVGGARTEGEQGRRSVAVVAPRGTGKASSSPFNRRGKNLSVTGRLRSETKVRLRSSRRVPCYRADHAVIRAAPWNRANDIKVEGRVAKNRRNARRLLFQKPRYTFWILNSSQTTFNSWLGWSTNQEPCSFCCRRCASSRRADRCEGGCFRQIHCARRRTRARLHRHTENGANRRCLILRPTKLV